MPPIDWTTHELGRTERPTATPPDAASVAADRAAWLAAKDRNPVAAAQFASDRPWIFDEATTAPEAPSAEVAAVLEAEAKAHAEIRARYEVMKSRNPFEAANFAARHSHVIFGGK